MIFMTPEGGLCNRMRAIGAAVLLSRSAGAPLTVNWRRTSNCNASFSSIFRLEQLPFAVMDTRGVAATCIWGLLREQAARFSGQCVIAPRISVPSKFPTERVVATARRRDVLIRSGSRFLSAPKMFRWFEPTAAIEERIDSMKLDWSQAIAVHIRRTDNHKATAMSPLSAFVRLILQELSVAPQTRFFVATDSPDAFLALRQRFGTHVCQLPKRSLKRSEPEAIVDAAADLYALSRCRKLIGSYWSSFTNIAAELRGIDTVIARTRGSLGKRG